MIRIQSADLIHYNANDRGNNAPDCVKRAISMAFSIQYSQVAKDLRAAQAEVRAEKHNNHWQWNMPTVYRKVIKQYGGSDPVDISKENITVAEFADTHTGTYLLQTGKTNKKSDHLLCLIDGEVFDSWDSLDQIVISYITVEGEHKPKSNIKDRFKELYEYANNLIDRNIEARIRKFGLEGVVRVWNTTNSVRSFALQIHKYFESAKFNDYNPEFTVTYAFSPTTTFEEAIQYIDKITATRVYDRMWVIKDKVRQLEEAQQYNDITDKDLENRNLWIYNDRDLRFYNSLPEWLKRRITYLYIYYPGEYSDSYVIRFKPLPGDPDKDEIRFEGRTAYEIKDRIDNYKKNNYDREWYEYD